MAEVVLFGRFWRGDHAVDEDDSAIIFIEGVEVDGERIYYERATLSWAGRAPCEEHRRKLEETQNDLFVGEFLTIVLEGVPKDQWLKFDPEDYILGTTEEQLILPVARLSFKERVTA